MVRRRVLPPVLLLAAVTAAAWWGVGGFHSAGAAPALSEGEIRNLDIAFYRRRAERDPQGAADRAQLAGLYQQRGRETGNLEDFRRAEGAARASLARRDFRNGKARLTLASSLLAQHRFVEALEAARLLCALEPDEVAYRALVGEIELELGRYEEAGRTFRALAGAWRNLAVAPRLARWAEIRGRTPEARYILGAARDEAMRRPHLPREQVAWFHLRVADLELRNGRLANAERALRDGLAAAPDDYRLLAARARLELARRRWTHTIRYGERAVRLRPDLATLALLADAYRARGDSAQAEQYFAAVERFARENPEPFNRVWTGFLLDHDRRLPETLALLRQEIRVRQDVYGYDQLAWAAHKTGDAVTADAAIRAALRMGTRDAVVSYHAGMIARARGDTAAAEQYLAAALSINPTSTLSPLAP
ncbi:MAG: tetratricopeptide repeat protein [Gemmatimonadales bacterium]